MAKILCIEVGSSVTRVSEMDYKVKNPKIYKYFSIPTPKGVVEDGFIQENPEFCLTLKRALSENGVKTKNVVFSVASTKIVTREVTIPEIKMNQVASYVKANANDYFPIDLSLYEVAHVMLGVEQSTEGGPGKYKIMVMAAGKDLISGYAKFANNCGLKLSCVDYSGNSVYQLMRNECSDAPTLVVKLEDNFTIASVIANRGMALQRSLAYGFDRAVNSLMESPDFFAANYNEAFRTMCDRPCIKVVINERTKIREKDEVTEESEIAAEARAKITASFTQLLGNLTRVVELYNSKDPSNPVREVLLVGLGSEIMNMTKLITNELGIPVRVCKHLDNVSAFQPMDGINYGRFINVFGAAIEPVGLVATQAKGKKTKSNINYTQLSFVFGILALILIGGMFIIASFKVTVQKRVNKDLLAQEAKYAEAEVVHNRYLAIQELQKNVNEQYNTTLHPNDNLTAMFEELQEKLPVDIKMFDIVSDDEKATMSFQAADYQEVAKIFQIIRGFDCFMDVTMGMCTEEEETAEDGEVIGSHIKFETICFYFPQITGDTQTTVIDLENPEDASSENNAEAQ